MTIYEGNKQDTKKMGLGLVEWPVIAFQRKWQWVKLTRLNKESTVWILGEVGEWSNLREENRCEIRQTGVLGKGKTFEVEKEETNRLREKWNQLRLEGKQDFKPW